MNMHRQPGCKKGKGRDNTIVYKKGETREHTARKLEHCAGIVRKKLEDIHPNPKGECFAASIALCITLAKFGYTPFIMEGYIKLKTRWIGHYWVEVAGFLVDITADQFNDEGANYPGILIRDITDKGSATSHDIKIKHHWEWKSILDMV